MRMEATSKNFSLSDFLSHPSTWSIVHPRYFFPTMATSLTQKMYTVSRGHHYTYYTQSRTVAGGKPKQTILLLHGWPDDASVWANVITNTFLPRGYGVIAPDCLGWGGSSKPLDEKDYDFQLMCKDLSELLDVEGLGRVVVSAHDWVLSLSLEVQVLHL